MAASSSSSSAAPKGFDVFISCRGEDTRYKFTSHLVDALSRNSIRAYVDYEPKKGDEISSSTIRAIHDSYGSVIVLSKNYASSKWCLNELVQILECRKQGHFVVPVFYNMDPSWLRKQTASYGQTFAIHKQDSRNKEKLQSWKAALTEAANIAGWEIWYPAERGEFQLIRNIVNNILQKMDHIYQIKESRFVGIDKYYKDIESLLERSSVVGIWGMGGVGKTTIAKVVFDKLFCQYDSSYFFENVKEELERNIREELPMMLSQGEYLQNITSKAQTLKYAMRRLSSEKVLIVLDDVDNSKQIEYLQQECNCLSADSKIIITTRDKHLLNGFRFCHEVYEVRELDFEKSLQLFRLYAFNESYLETGYEEITEKFVDYARGIPLVLKVLGSFLLSKSKEEWESALEKLSKIPNDDIQKVLRLGYDGLDPLEQQIFLNIACFLKGEYIEHVISFLDSCGFFGHIGIRSLQDKALVFIYDRRVQMHDFIQEMGQHIVRGVSINSPGEHSQLWIPGEHPSLLHLQTLVHLDVRYCRKLMALQSESHLRSLQNLSFRGCSSLREFSVSSEKIEELLFEDTAVDILPSSIRRSKNLKFLEFMGPVTKIPSQITKLTSLEVLYIYHCRGFNSSELHVIFDALPSLEELCLNWCSELSQLPDNISVLSSLKTFSLLGSSVESLPTSIKHLPCLKYLDVSCCQRLRSLPELPPSTIDLQAKNCPILETLIPSTRLEHCRLDRCVKLDQQSIDGVMAAVHYRIKRAEPSCVSLPGDRVPRCFRYWTTQDRINIELPPRSDLLGFAFCFTVSRPILGVKCVCYLEECN